MAVDHEKHRAVGWPRVYGARVYGTGVSGARPDFAPIRVTPCALEFVHANFKF